MISTVTCVKVSCDTCGRAAAAFKDDPGSEAHFPSPSVAITQLASWQLNPGTGTAECPDCVAIAACQRDGHTFEEWRCCGCQGRIAAHRDAATVDAILTNSCAIQYRRCTRCPIFHEERPRHAAPQDV